MVHLRRILFCCFAWFLLALPPAAAGPWQWDRTLAGDNDSGPLSLPGGIFVDGQRGRYYLADTGNHRLVSFDRQGRLLHVFTADDQLLLPRDLTRDAAGVFWVVDRGNSTLAAIEPGKHRFTSHTIRRGGATVVPARVAAVTSGLLVLDSRDGAVLRLDEQLAVRGEYQCREAPLGCADFFLAGDRLFLLARGQGRVDRWRLAGGHEGGVTLTPPPVLGVALAVTDDGQFLVLDRHRGQVLAYAADGGLAYRLFGQGHTQEKLYYPASLTLDPWGNLCVVDEGNGRVEIYRR